MIVKLQYKEFEPGEFTDIADRTCEQTIELINSFPWEAQRDQLKVSLTNPSVSIEDGKGGFLKLALYYGGNFVLHYFDREHRLFNKSLTRFTDSHSYIQQFFSNESFNTTDFHLERTWPQHNLIHFATQDFHYQLTTRRIVRYLIYTSAFNFLIAIVLISLILIPGVNPASVPWIIVIIFLIGGGPNLILFFNYLRHAEGKLLIMSRGNPVFYFGEGDNPELYNKTDILSVTRYCYSRSGGGGGGEFQWVEIILEGGRSLIIPNLLIDQTELTNKLYQHPAIVRTMFFPAISGSTSSHT